MVHKHQSMGAEWYSAEEMRRWSDTDFAEYWGEKCPEYDAYCACCTAWRIRELEARLRDQLNERT